MRLLVLIGKEWRDARPATVACALVAIGLSIAANEAYFGYRDAFATTRVLIPALLLITMVVLAADLVARDVATRRIESMALLPIRPVTLWLAKALFLSVAGGACLAWLVLIQFALALLVAPSGQVAALLGHVRDPEALTPVVLVFSISCVVLFFSTILERGFVALLASLLVVAALASAIEVHPDPGRIEVLGPGIGLAFLVGSATAFTVGRIHGRPRARRALVGVATVLILLLATAAFTTTSASVHVRSGASSEQR